MTVDLETIERIAMDAGQEILAVYHDVDQASVVDYKDDNSPLTLADQRANDCIVAALRQHFPEVPILSEEGQSIGYETRKQWDRFWLVDPLDGTKEFIHRNGEFTVNIALVQDRRPLLGVVHVPVTGVTYSGQKGVGAVRKQADGESTELHVSGRTDRRIAVRSKSHASPEEETVLQKYGVVDTVSVGSSLKFCRVAEGQADVYYRHGPTMEWDVAAGQAVAEAAGGQVYAGTGPDPFLLNKKDLLNGSFLCLGCDYIAAD